MRSAEIGRPRVGDAARGLRHLQDGDRRHLVALARLLPHHHAAGRVEGAEISRDLAEVSPR